MFEDRNLTSPPSSKNFLLALDSTSKPLSGAKWRMFRRGIKTMLLLLMLGALFALARRAFGQSGYQFPANVNVGASTAQTVTLTMRSAGALSSIQALTGGTTGLDYSAVGGSCAAGSSYNVGQSCTVSVSFAPKFPGVRSGAVVLTDGSGVPMATSYLSGVGVGPLSVATAGEITTIAGNGVLTGLAFPAPGALAAGTPVNEPLGVAVDGAGNIYYTDKGNNLIGKVNSAGVLTIVAGTGGTGYSPNGTPATSAALNVPAAILLDGAGNVYFTEIGNNTVREVVKATGLIETVSGNGVAGYTGDGGQASAAKLNQPEGLAMGPGGDLYIADTGNNVIRRVSVIDGTITTVAGTGAGGFAGDGSSAAAAQLNQPWGISFASDGSLYIADFLNNRIRKIDTSGNISTVAGTGAPSYSGDSDTALNATVHNPASVVVDAAGDMFIADSENNVVRKVNGATQMVTTMAGNSAPASCCDGLNADSGTPAMYKVYGLALDGSGNLYIADRLGLRVRGVNGALGRIAYKDIKATNTSPPVIQKIDNDGNAPLSISTIVALSNAAIDPATTTCSTSVAMAPGAECNIGAEFKPMVVGSNVNGYIHVNSDSPSTPVVIDLFGNSLSIEPTTTTLSSSVNPSAVGQLVNFTATVSSRSSTLTGTVQFMDGSTALGGPQLLNSTTRTATFPTSSLTLGSHRITAIFTDGDGSSAGSTSAVLTQVVEQTSVLVLTSNENPAKVYDTVTFTVAVSETPSGGSAPTGSIVFSADGSLLPGGTVAITGGGASYPTALLPAGSHTITATYAGDANNLAGSSNALTEVVNAATTTTTLATSNASVPLTASVTFTATVVGSSVSTPTGNVTFEDGTTAIGTVAVNSAGVASFTTTTLTTGSHAITAAYQGDADYATSVSAPLTETVNKIATGTAVISSANPATAGATVRFTVTVTAALPTTPNVAITGTVNLMDGGAVIGTGAVSALGSGPATASVLIPVSSLALGTHAITAAYAGDVNYVGSGSGALSEAIVLATSSNVLTASPATSIATKPVMLSATLSSDGGTPTGTVTFLDGGTTLGAGTLLRGVATVTTTALTVGSHTITAVYGGDANDSTSTSNAVTVTVVAATTRVALTPSQSPTDFGQPLTLTAAVSGTGGVPTGSVTFYDGATTLGTATMIAGVATYMTSTLADGSHTFTASYSGDANDAASVSAPLTVQVLQTIDISVTSPSPNPSVARSNVHFVATITAKQSIPPTGSVTFLDNGGSALGMGVISGSVATLDTASLAVGTHAIVASYAGDGTSEPLNSPAYTQVVNAAGVTVTLGASANPATFGTLLTFTATASSAAGALTGTVKFEDGGATIGSAPLSSTGVATFSTSTLSPGAHSIVAAYQGDANDLPASSSTLSQVVERATNVSLTSSANPQLTLAPVTITATVTNGGGPAATGTVNFTQDGTVVATVPVNASGTAALNVASLPVGTHSFVAAYSGDAVDLASVSTPLSEVVQLRATTDVLTTSATSLTGGQQITLISIVRWSGPAVPTGTVTFFTGADSLATATVDATGVATVTALLSGSSANVSSSYSGDANYAPSTSATVLVTIGPAPDFSMAATPPVFTLVSKQHLIVSLTIGSLNNFTDTLSLGCLGLPKAATCTFSSDQMVLAPGASQSVTVTVDTGNPLLAGTLAKNEAPQFLRGESSKLVVACFLPGGLLLGLIGIRFRRVKGVGGLLLLMVLAGVSAATIGCGTVNMTGTPAGVYHFAVSATGKTGVTETLPMTMTVTE